MNKNEQTDLSYARGFFQAYLSADEADSGDRARGLIRAMASEIETLRDLCAKLERQAAAPRSDEEGAERTRCEGIVSRWIERIKGWHPVDKAEADGAGFVCIHILDEIRTGRPRTSSEAREGEGGERG